MGALRFFLIAGEPSGDRLGAALMQGLKTLHPEVQFLGVGGPLMAAEGLDSLFPMEELSIMGLIEILPKYLHLKRRIAETAEAALTAAPDALITIDSPDFCLRVAGLVKSARPDLRTIHYVAPSVWAWRPKRAEKMARVIDHVLALLPFEPPLMQAAGMSCDFVGHPVVSEPLASVAEKADFAGTKPLILVLPGSRKGEVTRLAPILGAVVAKVKLRYPTARIALPTLDNLAELVTKLSQNWAIRPDIITDAARKRGAFAAADVAIAASGTVSLELAANGCPMVIAYDMNRLTLAMMRRMALIDTVTLVNIVAASRTVPEFLGPRCTPDLIADAVFEVLNHPQAQKAAMNETMQLLGRGGQPPHLRAAQSVLAAL
jgi:lipid-A-disaccharide synthase